MAKGHKVLSFISNEIKAYEDKITFSCIKIANILKGNKSSFNKVVGNWHFHTYTTSGYIKCYSLSR